MFKREHQLAELMGVAGSSRAGAVGSLLSSPAAMPEGRAKAGKGVGGPGAKVKNR
jgi:hypothetical protein